MGWLLPTSSFLEVAVQHSAPASSSFSGLGKQHLLCRPTLEVRCSIGSVVAMGHGHYVFRFWYDLVSENDKLAFLFASEVVFIVDDNDS